MQANTVALISIGRCYASMEKPDLAKAIDCYQRGGRARAGNHFNMLLLGDCYCNITRRITTTRSATITKRLK